MFLMLTFNGELPDSDRLGSVGSDAGDEKILVDSG